MGGILPRGQGWVLALQVLLWGPVAWVPWVYRPPVGADGGREAHSLLLLCLTIVAGLAEGLEWATVELGFFASMGLYVVADLCWH
jgi:hypothetical protein